MSKFDETDVFTDASLVEDPFPYFEHLRSQCPVHPLPRRNVMVVTGYDEAISVYTNTKAFSSAIGVGGPIPPLPFEPEGDDISAQLEQFRDQMPYSTQIVTMDDGRHAATRSLLMRLFMPSRLRENEAYIRRVADERIDSFIDKGSCEFFSEYGHPFAMLVIADLLGRTRIARCSGRSSKTRRRPLRSMNTRLPTSSYCSWASTFINIWKSVGILLARTSYRNSLPPNFLMGRARRPWISSTSPLSCSAPGKIRPPSYWQPRCASWVSAKTCRRRFERITVSSRILSRKC